MSGVVQGALALESDALDWKAGSFMESVSGTQGLPKLK